MKLFKTDKKNLFLLILTKTIHDGLPNKCQKTFFFLKTEILKRKNKKLIVAMKLMLQQTVF